MASSATVSASLMLMIISLASQAGAQMMHTRNLAFSSPIVNRPDLSIPEPQHAQVLGRSLMPDAGTIGGFRSLLGHKSCWGVATSDAGRKFPQSVASGDPTAEGFIIWTRVPSTRPAATVRVQWAVARDAKMRKVMKSGSAVTTEEVDFTVKVDVDDLRPNRVYYYQFSVGNSYSTIGRTKTLPKENEDIDRASFAVASCAWLALGYFNAYKEIANFAQAGRIDAVLHLGDYIYEYNSTSRLPPGEEDRSHIPAKEIVTLDDYRVRHRQYDSDMDLKRMRASAPIIVVWDDHELTNNAWTWGAQNHNNSATSSPFEQEFPNISWDERKTNAIRAYYEYMPIRQADPDNQDRIYRKFQYGKLASLLMVDTRFIGRDQEYAQPYNVSDPRYFNTSRSLLGKPQRQWVRDELLDAKKNDVTWKVLGNQVVFSQWIFRAGGVVNTDSWDGYNMERERILQTLEQHEIDNMIVLTGDVHASFAMDVPREPSKPWDSNVDVGYDPVDGKGSLAVEMVCNSVTSGFRNMTAAGGYDALFLGLNRHIKYVQSLYKGFLFLELTPTEAAGTWVDVSTVLSKTYTVTYSDTMVTKNGANHIEVKAGRYLPRTPAPVAEPSPPPAPSPPPPTPSPPVPAVA